MVIDFQRYHATTGTEYLFYPDSISGLEEGGGSGSKEVGWVQGGGCGCGHTPDSKNRLTSHGT